MLPKCITLLFLWGAHTAAVAQTTTPLPTQTCPTDAWRNLAFVGAPLPNESYNPINIAYWRSRVLPRVAPNIVILATAIVITLLYIIWKLIRCCCCCCPSKPKYTPIVGSLRPQKRVRVLRCVTAALALGVLAGCLYGAIKADPQVLPGVSSLIDTVQAFVVSVVDTALAAVNTLGNLVGLLDMVNGIVENDINMPDIQDAAICIRDFLLRLADPRILQQQVGALYDQLNTSYKPLVLALKSSLLDSQALLTMLQGAVSPVSQTVPFLTTLTTQATAANAAIAALPPSHGAPAITQAQAVRAALLNMVPVSSRRSALAAQRAGLVAMNGVRGSAPVFNTTGRLSVDFIDESLDVASQATRIAEALGRYTNGLFVVQPCIQRLVRRVAHIDAEVASISNDLQAPLQQLNNTLTDVGTYADNDTAPPDDTIEGLQNVTNRVAVRESTRVLSTSLELLSEVMQELPDLQPAIDYIDALDAALAAAEAPLQALLDAVNTYLASPSSGTYAPVLTAAAPAQASLTAVIALSSNPPPSLLAAYAASQALAPVLSAMPDLTAQIQQLDAIAAAIDALPPRADVLSSLDLLTTMWDLLPASNRAQPIDNAVDVLQGLVDGLVQVVTGARDTVKTATQEVREQLDGVRDDVVGEIDAVEAKYMPRAQQYNKCLAGLLGLVLALAALIDVPIGVRIVLPLLLLFSTLLFLLALLAAVLLVAANDGCANVEQQILQRVASANDPNASPEQQRIAAMLQYYLYNQGGPLRALIKRLFDVDVDALSAQALSFQDDFITQIRQQVVVRPKLETVLQGFTVFTTDMLAAVGAVEAAVDVDAVHPLYMKIKAFPCCHLTGVARRYWVAGVTGGTFIIASFIAALAYLRYVPKANMSELDKYSTTEADTGSMPLTKKKTGSMASSQHETIPAHMPPAVQPGGIWAATPHAEVPQHMPFATTSTGTTTSNASLPGAYGGGALSGGRAERLALLRGRLAPKQGAGASSTSSIISHALAVS